MILMICAYGIIVYDVVEYVFCYTKINYILTIIDIGSINK